jgi:transcription initiation factor IIE alpha subunit
MRSEQQKRVIKALTDKGYTAVQLSELIHCTVRSARLIVSKLHKQGLIHIQSWHRVEYNSIPAAVYRYGIGVDAVRPKPMTMNERMKKWRAKESVEHREFRLARQRQLRKKIKRDPLVAAFFGSIKRD